MESLLGLLKLSCNGIICITASKSCKSIYVIYILGLSAFFYYFCYRSILWLWPTANAIADGGYLKGKYRDLECSCDSLFAKVMMPSGTGVESG